EDPEDDPEEDLADYPADGGDEGNDEDDSFDDEEDDDIDIEGDEEEDEPQTPISLPSDTEIAKHMAIPTPPPLPLSLLSLPLPPIPSPPLPLLSPPPTDPTYEEAPLGYREARLRWRAEREEILKADLPLRNRLCTAHTVTYELEESSAAATFRLREPVMDELYRLFRDMRYHAHTARLIEGEARASRKAWTQSIDASDAARSELIALCTQVLAQRTEITDLRATESRFQTTVGTQQEEIRELRAAHGKLQAKFIRALTALKSCQTQLTATLGHIQILEVAESQHSQRYRWRSVAVPRFGHDYSYTI
nr:hypothetical protein [Tanacetum cinerariifolium]